MKQAYKKIGWGLVLEIADVRIGGFDILPDIIGCVLILLGLARLRTVNRHFRLSSGAAFVLLLLAIPHIIQLQVTPVSGSQSLSFVQIAWLSVDLAVEMATLYWLCAGIRAHAEAELDEGLKQSAANRWNVYFLLGTAALIMMPFSMNIGPDTLFPVLVAESVTMFCAEAAIILLVFKAARELGAKLPPASEDFSV